MNSSEFSFSSIEAFLKGMKEAEDRIKNPNGQDKQVVRLENFRPGTLRLFKQIAPNCRPLEIATIQFKEGQNRLSLEGNFKGIVVGEPKDSTKKFQIEFVGYPEGELKYLSEIEERVNKK